MPEVSPDNNCVAELCVLALRESLSRLPREMANSLIEVFDDMMYNQSWNRLEDVEKLQVVKGFLGMTWGHSRSTFSINGSPCSIEFNCASKTAQISMSSSTRRYLLDNEATFPRLSSLTSDGVRLQNVKDSLRLALPSF